VANAPIPKHYPQVNGFLPQEITEVIPFYHNLYIRAEEIAFDQIN